MTKSIFDLDLFESTESNDILDEEITESDEFKDKTDANNEPGEHFEPGNSGEHGVSVPGGLKETPNAKPEGGEKGPTIPGGDNEKPSAKPEGGEKSIPVPTGVTLDQDTYNDALAQLKKSFTEGVELLDMITKATVVTESVEEKQEKFTEAAIDMAILESIENGPLFEKVDRSDKNEVKGIVSKLRSKVAAAFKEDKISFYVPNVWARLLVPYVATLAAGAVASPATASAIMAGKIAAAATVAGGYVATAAAAKKSMNKAWRVMFTTRLWQILGICHLEDGNIDDYTKGLTEKFKDELGEYKVLAVEAVPTIRDAFKNHFGWKNSKRTWLLLVDKKVPSEIKKLQNELVEEIKDTVEKSEEADKKEEDNKE